jgi:hypothetical protein
MTPSEVLLERLASVHPDALLLEPREWYDACVVGLAVRHDGDYWNAYRGDDAPLVAVYDYDLLVDAFLTHGAGPEAGCSYEEAREFVDFNMVGAWLGSGTPIIVPASPGVEDAPDLVGDDGGADAEGTGDGA